MVAAGQQAQGDDPPEMHGERSDVPSVDTSAPVDAAVQAKTDQAAVADEDGPVDGDDEAAAAESPPRPRPAVPVKLLLLVTVLNILLAAGLLTLRPPWRVERSDAPPRLPPQVAELQARVARGEHQAPYTLTLTDDELTATAHYFLAQSEDVPFSQVRVAVVDGRLEATGVTTGLAVAVPVRIVANVEARNGEPTVSVVDVGIGGLALPTFVREQILTEANRAVDLSRYDLPVTVDACTLRPGALDVRGTVR